MLFSLQREPSTELFSLMKVINLLPQALLGIKTGLYKQKKRFQRNSHSFHRLSGHGGLGSKTVVEDFWLPKVNGALGKGKVKGVKQTQNQAPFQHVVCVHLNERKGKLAML